MTLCRRLGKRDELTKPDEVSEFRCVDRSIRRIQEFDCKVLSMNAMPSTGKNRSGRNYLMRFIVDNDNERWTYDENDNDAENDENDQILDRKEAIRIRI